MNKWIFDIQMNEREIVGNMERKTKSREMEARSQWQTFHLKRSNVGHLRLSRSISKHQQMSDLKVDLENLYK
jgi:hypothetical protein